LTDGQNQLLKFLVEFGTIITRKTNSLQSLINEFVNLSNHLDTIEWRSTLSHTMQIVMIVKWPSPATYELTMRIAHRLEIKLLSRGYPCFGAQAFKSRRNLYNKRYRHFKLRSRHTDSVSIMIPHQRQGMSKGKNIWKKLNHRRTGPAGGPRASRYLSC